MNIFNLYKHHSSVNWRSIERAPITVLPACHHFLNQSELNDLGILSKLSIKTIYGEADYWPNLCVCQGIQSGIWQMTQAELELTHIYNENANLSLSNSYPDGFTQQEWIAKPHVPMQAVQFSFINFSLFPEIKEDKDNRDSHGRFIIGPDENKDILNAALDSFIIKCQNNYSVVSNAFFKEAYSFKG